MSSHYPPLTCEKVKNILKNLGFEKRATQGSGTSHEQWIKDSDGKRYKVTVDCPKAPFSQILISSMARQAGVTKKKFYNALGK
jgi:predicted RNA binding protein YcfA (HicA-like mRNA interferase family)